MSIGPSGWIGASATGAPSPIRRRDIRLEAGVGGIGGGFERGKLGRRGLTYLTLFQVLLPLLAPVVDVFAIYGLVFLDPLRVGLVWLGFLAIPLAMGVYAFRLAGARAGQGYALEARDSVSGEPCSQGSWSAIQFSFGEMLARASADVRLRRGEIVGSGTLGTGCLLEIREETLGRYLSPGDVVVLEVERLGRLETPIVERPEAGRG